MAKQDRFRNVKQAEYELLKIIMTDEVIRERYHDRLKQGVVGDKRGRQITRNRANKALDNIAAVLRGMMEKRIKHLPEYHLDFESEVSE
ncbi:unnamed protein product [marine sediment metagenome]|uniref:Uncharacterized protein n=1 Tax=marine sediment metagenome TaxID=412755 RepID=X1URW6_9ZZZZ